MPLKEGAIEQGVVRTRLAWPHTEIGAHVSRAIPVDATTPGIVACYMVRPPITRVRMLGETGKDRITHRSDAVHRRHRANFRSAEPFDMLRDLSTVERLATKPRPSGAPHRHAEPPSAARPIHLSDC